MPTPAVRTPAVRALAAVNLAAIERNCARLCRDLAPGAELAAVVKADAYGHGAAPCARAALAGGATWLAVATADEAASLRGQGLEARVLVMGALTAQDLEVALDADADVVAWNEPFVSALEAHAGERRRARVHVKLDTGMGRLGTADPESATRVAERLSAIPGVELAGAMTHFATADDLRDGGFLHDQLARFRRWVEPLRDRHPGLVAHAANSAATLREPASHLGLVRCGIAVYGMDPFNHDAALHGLEPALELSSYVADLKRRGSGESAGYGRRYVAREDTVLGVLPIGYGDGVRRGLTNNADVLVGGRRRPLVGTVSMDNITVGLGRDAGVEPGARATLIGADGDQRITAEEIARRLATINYEVTCGLTARVPRHHHRDGTPV